MQHPIETKALSTDLCTKRTDMLILAIPIREVLEFDQVEVVSDTQNPNVKNHEKQNRVRYKHIKRPSILGAKSTAALIDNSPFDSTFGWLLPTDCPVECSAVEGITKAWWGCPIFGSDDPQVGAIPFKVIQEYQEKLKKAAKDIFGYNGEVQLVKL